MSLRNCESKGHPSKERCDCIHCSALIAVCFICSAVQSTAQEAVAEPLEVSEAGQAYLQATGRRVNSDVAYFDPTRPAPALETNQSPDRAASPPLYDHAPQTPEQEVPMDTDEAPAVEEEDEADPEALRLEDAKLSLTQPDAMMEHGAC